MHKLIDYICDELESLERKADKDGKLTVAEVEYGDMLAHFKKNLLTADAMMNPDDYSYDDMGNSYARGRRNVRRDSMGRYSRNSYDDGYQYRRNDRYSRDNAKEDMLNELKEMHADAQDEDTKQMIKNLIRHMEER